MDTLDPQIEQFSQRYKQRLRQTDHHEQSIPSEKQFVELRSFEALPSSHLYMDHDRSKKGTDPLCNDRIEWSHDRSEIPYGIDPVRVHLYWRSHVLGYDFRIVCDQMVYVPDHIAVCKTVEDLGQIPTPVLQ